MNRFYLILFLLISSLSFSYAQSVDELKSQRKKSENEIKKLNSLIDEAKKNKNSSIQQINLYDKKISETNSIINTLNREVDYLNRDIESTLKIKKRNYLNFMVKLYMSSGKLKILRMSYYIF